MKKLFVTLIVMLAFATNADAQGILGRLKDRAVNAAKNAVERKVENVTQETEGTTDDASEEEVSSKNADDDEAAPATASSSDFKRGSVILFQDDVTAETVGEFPSKWDLFQGTVETKTLGGVKAINLTDNAQVQPLIKEQGGYLPEEFTIEYDFYY